MELRWLLPAAMLALGWILIMVKTAMQSQHKRLFIVLLFCWLVTYIPYLSLGISLRGYESDRYLYTPSACWVVLTTVSMIFTYQILRKFIRLYLACLIVFFMICLWQSAASFATAGDLCRETLHKICTAPLGKKIELKGLPASYHGIPVLRYGLQEGVLWLCASKPADETVQVIDEQQFWKNSTKDFDGHDFQQQHRDKDLGAIRRSCQNAFPTAKQQDNAQYLPSSFLVGPGERMQKNPGYPIR